jgi:DNA-binding Xre family transcriptional regulator
MLDRVIGEARLFRTLPPDQLAEVLSASEDHARELFIGGAVDPESGTLALVRGDLDRVFVPLSIFRPSGTSKPEFRRFELDDYGHTIRFGGYEAAAEFVLYEVDPEYRRRVNAQRRAEEQGFGPSLRRLRIQRGLSREDFPGVSAKTIARIERGEVEKPHGKTLRVIAAALDVEPGEIEGH